MPRARQTRSGERQWTDFPAPPHPQPKDGAQDHTGLNWIKLNAVLQAARPHPYPELRDQGCPQGRCPGPISGTEDMEPTCSRGTWETKEPPSGSVDRRIWEGFLEEVTWGWGRRKGSLGMREGRAKTRRQDSRLVDPWNTEGPRHSSQPPRTDRLCPAGAEPTKRSCPVGTWRRESGSVWGQTGNNGLGLAAVPQGRRWWKSVQEEGTAGAWRPEGGCTWTLSMTGGARSRGPRTVEVAREGV